MKDEVLFSITKVTDDDSGMYSIGDLDYRLPFGPLEEYLKTYGYEGRNALFAQLGQMMVKIDETWREVCKTQIAVAEEIARDA